MYSWKTWPVVTPPLDQVLKRSKIVLMETISQEAHLNVTTSVKISDESKRSSSGVSPSQGKSPTPEPIQHSVFKQSKTKKTEEERERKKRHKYCQPSPLTPGLSKLPVKKFKTKVMKNLKKAKVGSLKTNSKGNKNTGKLVPALKGCTSTAGQSNPKLKKGRSCTNQAAGPINSTIYPTQGSEFRRITNRRPKKCGTKG